MQRRINPINPWRLFAFIRAIPIFMFGAGILIHFSIHPITVGQVEVGITVQNVYWANFLLRCVGAGGVLLSLGLLIKALDVRPQGLALPLRAIGVIMILGFGPAFWMLAR